MSVGVCVHIKKIAINKHPATENIVVTAADRPHKFISSFRLDKIWQIQGKLQTIGNRCSFEFLQHRSGQFF